MIAAIALTAAALSTGSGAAPARLALSVSPAHVTLAAGEKATVRVGGTGGRRLLLRATVAGLALDARGRPRITALRDAGPWLTVRPQTISAGRHGATFVVRSRRPAKARPGDHSAIVLVTATAPSKTAIAVEMRVGLVVTVRVAGRMTRRVEVIAARVRHLPGKRGRVVLVTVANRGDVIESIGGAQLGVTLLRRGRAVARFRVPRRKVLPRTSAVVRFRWPAHIRQGLVARIAVARPGGGTTTRAFRLKL
ncbi:MAG TPA: hypothetical protein VH210_09025 [Gaiellaceae bacterium]|nr:hypothetical protein [Gaiellaceae bacterium]